MASLLVALAGFVAVLLFIFGLKRMSSPVTATHGIIVAGWGMALAVLASFLYLADGSAWSQLAMGLVGLGLGMFGLLKTAIEIFEHHRLDRNP